MKSKKFPPEESITPVDSVVFPNPLLDKKLSMLGSPTILRDTLRDQHLSLSGDSLDEELVFKVNKADNGYYIVCGKMKKIAKTSKEILEIFSNLVKNL